MYPGDLQLGKATAITEKEQLALEYLYNVSMDKGTEKERVEILSDIKKLIKNGDIKSDDAIDRIIISSNNIAERSFIANVLPKKIVEANFALLKEVSKKDPAFTTKTLTNIIKTTKAEQMGNSGVANFIKASNLLLDIAPTENGVKKTAEDVITSKTKNIAIVYTYINTENYKDSIDLIVRANKNRESKAESVEALELMLLHFDMQVFTGLRSSFSKVANSLNKELRADIDCYTKEKADTMLKYLNSVEIRPERTINMPKMNAAEKALTKNFAENAKNALIKTYKEIPIKKIKRDLKPEDKFWV